MRSLMVAIWSLKFIRHELLGIATLILGINICLGQYNQVKKVVSNTTLVDITTDNMDNIYASDLSGNIFKYDKNWSVSQKYSPRTRTPFTTIDASSLKFYAFSRNRQELVILNRFLSQPITYDLKTLNVQFATELCRGTNNSIWIFDQSTLEVKNIDFLTGEELVKINIQKIRPNKPIEVINLKFMNDQLFIHIKDFGVILMDNLGNVSREIALSSPEIFGFNGNQIFYFLGKDLSALHLDYELKQNYEMPENTAQKGKKLIKTGAKTLLLKSDGIYDIETIYGH